MMIQGLLTLRRICRDQRGQNLIEYAIMYGFVPVASGSAMPNVASSISTVFSEIASVLTTAASQS